MVLSLGHFAVDLCCGIWPVYKTMAGFDLTIAGLVATIAGIFGNAMQLAFGLAADRGRRKLLLVGGLVLSGAIVFVPLVQSLPLISLLVPATSIGSAAFHPTATGAASSLASHRSGVMVGVYLTGGYVGYALSQWVFTSVFSANGGSTEILLIVPVLAAIAVVKGLEAAPGRPKSLSGMKELLTSHARKLGALFAIQVFASSLNIGLIFLLPDLLKERGTPDWILYGGGHAALVLGGSLALLPAGHAADKWGARRVLLSFNVIAGALFALLLFSPFETASLLILLTLFGAANGANNVVLVAEGNRSLPGRNGAVSAMLMGLPWCISGLTPLIVGHLANPVNGGSVGSALAKLGFAVLGSLIATGLLPKRNR